MIFKLLKKDYFVFGFNFGGLVPDQHNEHGAHCEQGEHDAQAEDDVHDAHAKDNVHGCSYSCTFCHHHCL